MSSSPCAATEPSTKTPRRRICPQPLDENHRGTPTQCRYRRSLLPLGPGVFPGQPPSPPGGGGPPPLRTPAARLPTEGGGGTVVPPPPPAAKVVYGKTWYTRKPSVSSIVCLQPPASDLARTRVAAAPYFPRAPPPTDAAASQRWRELRTRLAADPPAVGGNRECSPALAARGGGVVLAVSGRGLGARLAAAPPRPPGSRRTLALAYRTGSVSGAVG